MYNDLLSMHTSEVWPRSPCINFEGVRPLLMQFACYSQVSRELSKLQKICNDKLKFSRHNDCSTFLGAPCQKMTENPGRNLKPSFSTRVSHGNVPFSKGFLKWKDEAQQENSAFVLTTKYVALSGIQTPELQVTLKEFILESQ